MPRPSTESAAAAAPKRAEAKHVVRLAVAHQIRRSENVAGARGVSSRSSGSALCRGVPPHPRRVYPARPRVNTTAGTRRSPLPQRLLRPRRLLPTETRRRRRATTRSHRRRRARRDRHRGLAANPGHRDRPRVPRSHQRPRHIGVHVVKHGRQQDRWRLSQGVRDVAPAGSACWSRAGAGCVAYHSYTCFRTGSPARRARRATRRPVRGLKARRRGRRRLPPRSSIPSFEPAPPRRAPRPRQHQPSSRYILYDVSGDEELGSHGHSPSGRGSPRLCALRPLRCSPLSRWGRPPA